MDSERRRPKKRKQIKKQNEITAKNLIDKGYFPKEIPRDFNTKNLGDVLESLNLSENEKKWTKTLNISIPKSDNYSRRILNIPSPYHQIRLSKLIEEHSDKLDSFYKKSIISLTKPVVKKDSDRAVEREYHFSEKVERRINNTFDKRVILKADISRYFPTIYTHSIPWALHTKEEAKKKIRDKTLLGNKLDECLSYMQDGQTFGIPVGPDTSLFISEIIGTAIDEKLQNAYPKLSASRYTDDFEIFLNSYSEAEEVLNKLQEIVREFELDINSNKTEIITLPSSLEPEWISNLKLYHFRNSMVSQRFDIITFFSKAYEYQKNFPSEGVLKYSIQKIKHLRIFEDNWGVFESLILQSILVDPSTIPIVQDILLGYKEKGYSIDEDKIQSTVSEIIRNNSKLGNSYEVIWALTLSNKLELMIPKEVSEILINTEDSISNILTMEAFEKGYIVESYDLNFFKSLLNVNELYGRNWLFAYEMSIKQWLSPLQNGDYVQNDKFYSQLYEKGTEFYTPIAKEDDEWLKALLDDEVEEGFIRIDNPKSTLVGLRDY